VKTPTQEHKSMGKGVGDTAKSLDVPALQELAEKEGAHLGRQRLNRLHKRGHVRFHLFCLFWDNITISSTNEFMLTDQRIPNPLHLVLNLFLEELFRGGVPVGNGKMGLQVFHNLMEFSFGLDVQSLDCKEVVFDHQGTEGIGEVMGPFARFGLPKEAISKRTVKKRDTER
jgi:hypothetical protein